MLEDRLLGDAVRSCLVGAGLDVLAVTTCADAKAMMGLAPVDLVLLDLGLPDLEEVLAECSEQVNVRYLVGLGVLGEESHLNLALTRRFDGYVTRDASMAELIRVVAHVLGGRTMLAAESPQDIVSPADAGARPRLVSEALPDRPRLSTPQGLGELTSREREVLQLLVEGLSSQGISRRLNITRHTVRSHVQNIMAKLHVHSRLEAAAVGARFGASIRPRGRSTSTRAEGFLSTR